MVSNQNVATFIKELVLELDEGQALEFEAGAFIQIDIPEYAAEFKDFSVAERYKAAWKQYNLLTLRAGTDEPVNRAYSLANPPAEPRRLKFTIRIATPPPGQTDAPPGVGSSYVFNLKPGDHVVLSGPYGDFMAKPTQRRCASSRRRRHGAPAQPYSHQLLELKTRASSRSGTAPVPGRRCFTTKSSPNWIAVSTISPIASPFPIPSPKDHWEGATGYIHEVARDTLSDGP